MNLSVVGVFGQSIRFNCMIQVIKGVCKMSEFFCIKCQEAFCDCNDKCNDKCGDCGHPLNAHRRENSHRRCEALVEKDVQCGCVIDAKRKT